VSRNKGFIDQLAGASSVQRPVPENPSVEWFTDCLAERHRSTERWTRAALPPVVAIERIYRSANSKLGADVTQQKWGESKMVDK
jgi:hypothetical protein